MKLQILSAVHSEYPAYFYKKHPGLERKSFAEQKEILDYDAHSWADFWSHALAPHGFEASEINVNIRPLQKTWAAEHRVRFKRDRWVSEIASAQIKEFQPEVLFLADFSHFDSSWLREVKESCPKLRLILIWYGASYPDHEILKGADAVLSCISELVEQCRALGLKAYELRHAFEPRILERLQPRPEPSIDFSFVGQIVRGKGLHNQRMKILKEIAKHYPIRIYTPGKSRFGKWKSEGGQYIYGFAKNLKAAGVSSAVLNEIPVVRKAAKWTEPPEQIQDLNPPVFGLEMFQTLRNSRVTFNQHIDVSERSASNMRLFEATGVGTCLLTDQKENLAELFESDRELVSYANSQECLEKLRWLLEHPSQREGIARAGQARTLKDHTFSCRAVVLSELIHKLI